MHNSLALSQASRPTLSLTAWRTPLLALLVIALVILAPGEPPLLARLSLGIFSLALVAWLSTTLDSTHVALSAVLALLAVGATTPAQLGEALGHPLIMLLLCAFVLGAALRQGTLATRLCALAVARTRSFAGLCRVLSGVILLTALLIPSTSGRAALLMPVYLGLAEHLPHRQRRVLGLLFPSVVLLSACASLLGAGAHLLAVELTHQAGYGSLDFLAWLRLGLPLAVLGSVLATEVILRLFLRADERRAPLTLRIPAPTEPLQDSEKQVLLALGVATMGWLGAPLHGVDPLVVALGAALLVTLPGSGALSLKAALKQVEWSLLGFLAALLVVGESLMHSGAMAWLLGNLSGSLAYLPPQVALAGLLGVAVATHLLVGSRTARAALLIPLALVVAPTAGLAPLATAFAVAVASGYCLSLPVSAKPLALYGGLEQASFSTRDLLRLSAWLAPLYWLLVLLFSLWIWPWMGLGG